MKSLPLYLFDLARENSASALNLSEISLNAPPRGINPPVADSSPLDTLSKTPKIPAPRSAPPALSFWIASPAQVFMKEESFSYSVGGGGVEVSIFPFLRKDSKL